MQIAEFQSTLPRGERPLCGSLAPVFQDFNPRSREGSDPINCAELGQFLYFNPRSREGSDGLHGAELSWLGISIHAPARGATQSKHCKPCYPCISIHAPARGATDRSVAGSVRQTNFNPRSREGSDDRFLACRFSLRIFQSTLPRGERP